MMNCRECGATIFENGVLTLHATECPANYDRIDAALERAATWTVDGSDQSISNKAADIVENGIKWALRNTTDVDQYCADITRETLYSGRVLTAIYMTQALVKCSTKIR